MNTPPFVKFLLHIPEGFVSKIAVSFSNSWYDVTDGLASAEQLMLITLPRHALLLAADVVNCTFSGLSKGITEAFCQIEGRKSTAYKYMHHILQKLKGMYTVM